MIESFLEYHEYIGYLYQSIVSKNKIDNSNYIEKTKLNRLLKYSVHHSADKIVLLLSFAVMLFNTSE